MFPGPALPRARGRRRRRGRGCAFGRGMICEAWPDDNARCPWQMALAAGCLGRPLELRPLSSPRPPSSAPGTRMAGESLGRLAKKNRYAVQVKHAPPCLPSGAFSASGASADRAFPVPAAPAGVRQGGRAAGAEHCGPGAALPARRQRPAGPHRQGSLPPHRGAGLHHHPAPGARPHQREPRPHRRRLLAGRRALGAVPEPGHGARARGPGPDQGLHQGPGHADIGLGGSGALQRGLHQRLEDSGGQRQVRSLRGEGQGHRCALRPVGQRPR